MADRIVTPVPLSAERFAPYGDVIACRAARRAAMNEARFDRFDDLARVEVGSDARGRAAISIARSRVATRLPYRFDLVERHPLGSQAFVPLGGFRFIVVVAAPAETVEADDLEAFVTSGREGVNYHRGTWHLPLIALEAGQEFLIVDRAGGDVDCEERVLADVVVLRAP